MNVRQAIVAGALALSLTACAVQEDAAETDGSWLGTISTAGDVTTVVNEAGSVWGGPATLVEEASIGVDVGADEYMLGRIRGIAATERHIYVLDESVGVVRLYDYRGQHVRDLGGPGHGPGEFNDPRSLAVANDGTVYVFTGDLRVNVLSDAGETLDTWKAHPHARSIGGVAPVVTDDGRLWLPDYVEPASGEFFERSEGMRAVGPDGAADEPLLVPAMDVDRYQLVNEVGNMRMGRNVPFAPRLGWVLSPSGAIVFGFSSDYRLEIREPDGATTVVTKAWDPVPISGEQIEWNRQAVLRSMRSTNPEWEWNGPEIPTSFPAFSELAVGSDGRIWVRRALTINRIGGCDPDAVAHETGRAPNCWRTESAYDLFDTDGRLLGTVLNAPALRFPVFRGDHLIGYSEDETGLGTVKRYRLVPPGEVVSH